MIIDRKHPLNPYSCKFPVKLAGNYEFSSVFSLYNALRYNDVAIQLRIHTYNNNGTTLDIIKHEASRAAVRRDWNKIKDTALDFCLQLRLAWWVAEHGSLFSQVTSPNDIVYEGATFPGFDKAIIRLYNFWSDNKFNPERLRYVIPYPKIKLNLCGVTLDEPFHIDDEGLLEREFKRRMRASRKTEQKLERAARERKMNELMEDLQYRLTVFNPDVENLIKSVAESYNFMLNDNVGTSSVQMERKGYVGATKFFRDVVLNKTKDEVRTTSVSLNEKGKIVYDLLNTI